MRGKYIGHLFTFLTLETGKINRNMYLNHSWFTECRGKEKEKNLPLRKSEIKTLQDTEGY